MTIISTLATLTLFFGPHLASCALATDSGGNLALTNFDHGTTPLEPADVASLNSAIADQKALCEPHCWGCIPSFVSPPPPSGSECEHVADLISKTSSPISVKVNYCTSWFYGYCVVRVCAMTRDVTINVSDITVGKELIPNCLLDRNQCGMIWQPDLDYWIYMTKLT